MSLFDNHWQQQYLKTDNYLLEVSRGNVRGAYPFSAYGRVNLAAGSSGVLVQQIDGTTLNVPQSVQMSIVSTSVEDSPTGTGARSVVMEYLDGDLNYSYEVISMNGTTPVLTNATDVRFINGFHMATFGSAREAVGTINVTNGGITYARITAGGRTNISSFRRVPAGKTLFIESFYAGATSGTAAAGVDINIVTTFINGIDNQESGVFFPHAGTSLQDISMSISFNKPFPVPEGQIVGFVGGSDKAAKAVAGFVGHIE